jgi:hypothetical protein
MGVNISLYRGKSDEEHPTWDCARFTGDRQMVEVLAACGCHRLDIGGILDADQLYRPEDVEKFRDAMIAAYPENECRWRELADILKDESWWIYFGY